MTEKLDPKSPKAMRANGLAFFVMGVSFFGLGMINHNLLVFSAVGAAFFVIGIGLIAKAKKAERNQTGEGDQ